MGDADKKPPFVRGKDGILKINPDLSPWDHRSYQPPDEALNVFDRGELRLGCTHRRFENYSSFPCGNKPKHDPDANGRPTRCGIHSSAAEQRRKDKRDSKMQEWCDNRARGAALRDVRAEMIPLIQSIADGHNDPRSACSEWLAKYAEANSHPHTDKPQERK